MEVTLEAAMRALAEYEAAMVAAIERDQGELAGIFLTTRLIAARVQAQKLLGAHDGQKG